MTSLRHLRSSTANKRPDPAAMVDGQLAMNYDIASPGLFFKDDNGTLIKVGPVHVGTTAPNVSPAAGGTAGNSTGEQWLDTTGGVYVLKVWDGSAWRSESGTFVDVSGDTMTGALTMADQQAVRFSETTANGSNYIALQATASLASNKTITLPDTTGTVVTTGDTGTVTSTMIANDTILNADINASAAIAGTKVSPDFGSQNAVTTGTNTAANFIPTSSSVPANGVYLPAANSVGVATNSAECLRIDASGRLLVGTSNSADNARLNSKLSVVGVGAAQLPGIVVNGYTGTGASDAPFIDLGRSRGTTDGSYTEVVTDDALGYIIFRGADGAGWSAAAAAAIAAQADGDWTTAGDATDSPGRLVFTTCPNGSSTGVERMRIGNAGDIFFSTTSLDPATGCTMRSTAAGTYWINGTSDVGTWAQWTFKNGNGTVGSITTNGSATAYNTSSDYRLKENITLLDGAIDRLNQLSVHRFNFIADPDTVLDGFIAHEAAAVVPECVTGEKDAVDDDDNPIYQGIDQSKLVPLLTAALQEAIAKIDDFETRIAALELN